MVICNQTLHHARNTMKLKLSFSVIILFSTIFLGLSLDCNKITEDTTTCSTPAATTTTRVNFFRYALNLVSRDDCLSLPNGVFLTDSRHCGRYYICQNGRVTSQRCPISQWFDRENLICRNRNLVTNCPVNRT
ncbi:uncharacterized protein LOC109613332 [Musca domestica]|uniref:Uncharacterized protein LOC109613332 n=1 Tax=Musca domestica TaxID=7370 RepID=A0A9J7DIP6_MUSDO|nr:uncharacterized protein LOC109613332 [Musca domestica]